MLGMSVHDATGGYRVYRASALHRMDLHSVESQGYGFQVDMTWRAVKAGLTVVEVPIEFVERVIGESKMSGHIVQEAMLNVTKWSVTLPGGPPCAGAPRRPGRGVRRRHGTDCELRLRSGTRRVRRGRWPLLLVVLLLVVPLLEVVVIIAVGPGDRRVADVLPAPRGVGVRRLAGPPRGRPRLGRRCRRRSPPGRMPSRQLSDAALVLVGGVLLLAPGLPHRHRRVLPRPAVHPAGRARAARGGRRAPPAGRRVRAGWACRLRTRAGRAPGPASRSAAADDVIEGEVL